MRSDIMARNNVRVLGSGTQTMVFAHGYGCEQNMWRFVAPAFQDDYRVVLFDYVGSGKSDWSAYSPERYNSLEGYAQDVLDICHALDLKDILFVGHSVSSVIGMLAAIREPELFDRLILLGPSPCFLNDPPDYHGGFDRADLDSLIDMIEKNFIGWAHYLAPVVMKNPGQPELTEELEESLRSIDPATARRFAEVTFLSDNRADVPRVPVPSLILQSVNDDIAPMAVGEYLREHLPQNTFRVLDTTGHCVHMSYPEETIQAIRDYLNSSAAPPAGGK